MATTTTTTSYGTTTTTTTVTVKPSIYNDLGCSNGPSSCTGYGAWTNCLVDLYRGIDTNQVLYLLDKDGKPMDLDRIDKIDIMLYNEFGCASMSIGHGLSVESMQTTHTGNIFDINPDNFYKMKKLYFDLYNVRVTDNNPEFICPDDSKAIILGETNDDCITFGQIIFNPIIYNGDIYIEAKPHENNVGSAICMVNGLPQKITLGKKNRLINILDDSKDANLSIMSLNSDFEQTILMLDSISVSCTTGYTNKGMLKIFYSGSKIPKIPGRLTAEIIVTFNEDDEIEKGSTQVIGCVPLVNVRTSRLADTVPPDDPDDDEPMYNGKPFKIVDELPPANWNTMNVIYLIPSKSPSATNIKTEYITIKKKVNNGYTYTWEKVGENYDLVASQEKDNTAAINLTNNDDDLDSIIIRHVEQDEEGHGSMIEFDATSKVITANITKIDGGVL